MTYTLTSPLLPMEGRIALLERIMHTSEDQVHIEPHHVFAQGLYAREVELPAGCTAVGHRHLQEHVCIISKGRVKVVTEDGIEEIAAPAIMVVPAGRKNCVHAIEDTVWTTVHATQAATVEEAETLLVSKEDRPCLS